MSFKNCEYLKDIEIPKNIEHIGEFCFNNSVELKSVIFASKIKLKKIGPSSMSKTGIRKIVIPKSITEI